MFAFLSRKAPPVLLERMATLESSMERLELQVDDLKSLYRRLLGRMSHEIRGEREEVPRPEAGTAATGAHPLSTHGLLTDRQREIQQQILKRRAGG